MIFKIGLNYCKDISKIVNKKIVIITKGADSQKGSSTFYVDREKKQ